MTDWLLINEAAFIEYPADPNAKTPLKIAGVRVLENNPKGDEPCYFIYRKIFDVIIEGFPRKMAQNILFSTGLLKKPDRPEKDYDEFLFKVPKRMIGSTPRAYKIVQLSDGEESK